jgi:hypothetical protein
MRFEQHVWARHIGISGACHTDTVMHCGAMSTYTGTQHRTDAMEGRLLPTHRGVPPPHPPRLGGWQPWPGAAAQGAPQGSCQTVVATAWLPVLCAWLLAIGDLLPRCLPRAKCIADGFDACQTVLCRCATTGTIRLQPAALRGVHLLPQSGARRAGSVRAWRLPSLLPRPACRRHQRYPSHPDRIAD